MSDPLLFTYKTLEDLKQAISDRDADIPLSEDISILKKPVQFGEHTIPNRMSIQPMEGCDGGTDGSPGKLTFRRYRRFARGGAGLIWMEATSVIPEARANPRQLMLHSGTRDSFKDLVDMIRNESQQRCGYSPFLVLQMTHSGRYSRPENKPAPLIAHHSEILDKKHGLPSDYPLLTDEYLDSLQQNFIDMALLARDAGFNAVDIKSCHRYLISELHASFTRENSTYGGSLENRTRFLRETAEQIRDRVPDIEVTCRLNAFDGIEYPYGFGVSENDKEIPDLTEPLALISHLRDIGFSGINITIGNPYSNPHVGRPYDHPIEGIQKPDTHPLKLTERFIRVVRTIQTEFPDLCVIGGGYSWLRQFYPHAAAAILSKGWASIAGAGRMAFAYPDFARDIIEHSNLDPLKVCVTCSSCTQIMRDGGRAGCVLKDAEIYGPIFRQGRRRAEDWIRSQASRCRTCAAPTCSRRCPARVDIPGFMAEVSSGNYEEAYRILSGRNPLPELCALVCPTSETCEAECIYETLENNPVPIADVQYFVSRIAREQGFELPRAEKKPFTAAVIGSGPAGLGCAAALARAGCSVSLYEKEETLGGTVRNLIPEDRIAFADVDAEIEYIILNNPLISVHTGKEFGSDFGLEDLQDYDAVFLALGLGPGEPLPGPRPEGVFNALDILKQVKSGTLDSLPDCVSVIGGGNTAVDAALTAKKNGAEDVFLFYRRSLEEMPAWKQEYNKALAQGINFMILAQPVSYEQEKGMLTGMRVARTRLTARDDSGRRKPEIVPGSEYFFPCTCIIEAVGQKVPESILRALNGIELTDRGLISTHEGSFQTSYTRIFAGGDILNGGTTAVQGIDEGRRAAEEIVLFLENNHRHKETS